MHRAAKTNRKFTFSTLLPCDANNKASLLQEGEFHGHKTRPLSPKQEPNYKAERANGKESENILCTNIFTVYLTAF